MERKFVRAGRAFLYPGLLRPIWSIMSRCRLYTEDQLESHRVTEPLDEGIGQRWPENKSPDTYFVPVVAVVFVVKIFKEPSN